MNPSPYTERLLKYLRNHKDQNGQLILSDDGEYCVTNIASNAVFPEFNWASILKKVSANSSTFPLVVQFRLPENGEVQDVTIFKQLGYTDKV